jgi:hypothetical protein
VLKALPQDGAALASRGEASESRSAADRGAHVGSAGRRIACPTKAPARGGDSSHRCPGILPDRVTARWRNLHPGESRGTSRPETANHRTVVRNWDGPDGVRGVPGSRWRLPPPAGPGATIDPTPAIMSERGHSCGPSKPAWNQGGMSRERRDAGAEHALPKRAAAAAARPRGQGVGHLAARLRRPRPKSA